MFDAVFAKTDEDLGMGVSIDFCGFVCLGLIVLRFGLRELDELRV